MTRHLKKPLRAKKHKTAADKARFANLKWMRCCVCNPAENFYPMPDIHHIETGMGRRKDHQRTIPLCKKHHTEGMLSIHRNKTVFQLWYGSEAELLAKVNALLEATA